MKQHERRERTVAAVVDATIGALGQVGYARTTTAEIAGRAGVSQGGVFRHFDTRVDIVVAAAEAVCDRQLTQFERRLARTDGSLHELLRLTRLACRAPVNRAWLEVMAAARTDTELRRRLRPTQRRYYKQIVELARSQPVLAGAARELVEPAVMLVLHTFDGEALAGTDSGTVESLAALLTPLLAPAAPR